MNVIEHKEFRERMRLLLALFAHELPDRMDEIEALWAKLQIEWDIKVLQELHRSVHNLVSNGKTFGYPELSIEARALEQVLKNLMQKDISADALQTSRILQQILELKKISIEKESILTIEVISKATDEPALLPNILHTGQSVFLQVCTLPSFFAISSYPSSCHSSKLLIFPLIELPGIYTSFVSGFLTVGLSFPPISIFP